MKGQPTKSGGGDGPKWKGASYSRVNFPYERTTAGVRRQAAAAKKSVAKRTKKK